MAYDAFISYNHDADSTLAPLLQVHLQRFAKPWWRRRALSVFRDNTSLSANPGLWTSITKAMDDSRYFVLLASPEAAASPWVAKEIDYWRSTKPEGTLLPVLTEGEWEWDDAAGTFDWERSTAVPAALAEVYTEEPRHVDLRWARSEAQLDLRHVRFRSNIVELAAPMHGKPREDMEGEDVRQYRRTRRVVVAAVLALALLATSTGIGAVVAAANAATAQANETRAVSERERAEQSEALAEESQALAEENAARADENAAAAEQNAAEAAANQLEAEQNADEAAEFAQEAAANADEAVRNEGIALRNQRTAERNEEEALRQQDRAETQTRVATARQLAAQARADLDGPLDRSSLLALEAFRTDPLSESASAVLAAAQRGAGLQAVLRDDGDRVLATAVSPDGRTLASAGPESTLRLRDSGTGAQIRTLDNGMGGPSRIAFSPDGTLLAAAYPGGIQFWNVADGTPSGPLIALTALDIAFEATGGRLIAVGATADGAAGAVFIDVATRAVLGVPALPHAGPVPAVAVSIPGVIATGGSDQTVVLTYQDSTQRVLPTGQGAPIGVSSVAFSPDGRFVIAGTGTVALLWDVATGELRGTFAGHSGLVTALAVNADGSLLATTGADREVRVWDLTTTFFLGQLYGHLNTVADAAFAPGNRLITGSWDGTIRIWRTEDVILVRSTTSSSFASAITFRPDGTQVATGSQDGVIRLFDAATRVQVGVLTGHTGPVTSIVYSPDGRLLASGSGSAAGGADNSVRIWDTSTGTVVRTLTGHAFPVGDVAFNPGGTALASADVDSVVIVWDVATGDERIRLISGPDATGNTRLRPVSGLAFLSDDILIGARGPLEIWDLRTGPESRLVGPELGGNLPVGAVSVEVSPDRRTFVLGGGDGQIARWDAVTLQPRGEPFLGHVQLVRGFAFTPDGATFASVGQDGTIAFWDVRSGAPVGRPVVLSGRPVEGVAFAPDGSTVATTGGDGGVRFSPRYFFDRDIARQAERLCSTLGRNLTQAEWRQFLGAQPYRRTCPQWPAGG